MVRVPHRLLGLLGLLLVSLACSRGTRVSPKALAHTPSAALYHPEAHDAGGPSAALAQSPPAPSPLVEPLAIPGIAFVVESAIRRGELPGAVVAVGDHRGLRYIEAFGERTAGEAMTRDTRFDLASLTKPLTAASIMMLAERGVIDLRAPASTYLRELARPDKRSITLEQLLLHTSGLPKVNPLSACEHGRAHVRAAIARERMLTAPGTHFEYSDLGFILLGEVVESVTSMSLDAFASSQLFAPLGMRDTAYRPAPGEAMRCAPTELRDDILIRGVVDDPRAFRLNGVAGHAGVFSTADDLARFARMLLNHGALDDVRVLSEDTVNTFTTPHTSENAVRALGFDVQSSYALGRGRAMSPRAYGHGGYTGTSLWIDPSHDLFVILLSNRVHVGPKGNIHPLASAVSDLALRASKVSAPTAPLSAAAPAAPATNRQGSDAARVKLGIDVLEE
jgi:CubicO group peptidase (beta-lactamase class C family)